MTLEAFASTLDSLEYPTTCEGTVRADERIALALPDGDVGAVGDATFVTWLKEHGEPAPFGEGKETRVDASVRNALRLRARGKVDVHGFDPKRVLEAIEAKLSPRTHLAATLTDVIVYPEGGKFARHKDTPRTADLVGTLVVGLPVEHTGGAFVVEDGSGTKLFDWSGKPDPSTLRWVALFSDVDHEVELVTSGARVTLVYALTRTDRARDDANARARHAKLVTACRSLGEQQWPVMIACTRHAILDPEAKQQPLGVLRGPDRDLADALVEAGYDVKVRACLAATDADSLDGGELSFQNLYSIARLKKPLSPEDIDGFPADMITFDPEPGGEYMEDIDPSEVTIADRILDMIPIERWVVPKSAQSTLVYESDCFSDSGYFGNEAYEAHIYGLAALEVTRANTTVSGRMADAGAASTPTRCMTRRTARKPS